MIGGWPGPPARPVYDQNLGFSEFCFQFLFAHLPAIRPPPRILRGYYHVT
jgi:hypothetical protein